jgi:L-asparaginase
MSIKTIVQGATQLRASGAMLVAGVVVGASAFYGASVWAADTASDGETTPAAGTPPILVLATGGTISGTG